MTGPMQPLRCVRCGEPLAAGYQEICPRCGLPVAASMPAQQQDSGRGWQAAPSMPLGDAPSQYGWQAGYAPGPQPQAPYAGGFDQDAGPYPPTSSPYSQPANPGASGRGLAAPPSSSGYGQAGPPSMSGYPGYGQGGYGQGGYGYGAPGQPSATLPGYGQPAGPSVPLYGGPYQGMPPESKRGDGRAGLVIGLIVVVLVVFGASAYALIALAGKAPTTARDRAGATATVPATATSAPSGSIYASSLKGTIFGWPNRSGCASGTDGYHVQADVSCFAPTEDLSDFDLTVTAQQLSGDTGNPYGVSFRGSVSTGTTINAIYALFVSGDGRWLFVRESGGQATVIRQGTSSAISGSGPNVIEIRAKGSHFSFTINHAALAEADDGAISSGKCGLQGFTGSDIRFTDLTINRA